MNVVPIKLKGRKIKPHKAILNPHLNSKTVLTNSPWEFVELWLRREKKNNALFYWNQAQEFHKASVGLPIQSAPLLLYYAFMNAAKALLSAKNIVFNEYHGVVLHKIGGSSNKISIKNEGVKIKTNGVVPSLSTYFGETESSRIHSLKELLFNLPFIHRTYCLTFPSQIEMFIPLRECEYVSNKANRTAYFRAKLSADFSSQRIINRLPSPFELDSVEENDYSIKSINSVPFSSPIRPTKTDINNLITLHTELRKNLFHINGTQTLWYIKSSVSGPAQLNRFSPTLTLAAMHRLSELCRYRPLELTSFLSGKHNWLLSEFIRQSPLQFFDEIASEITGHQFLTPNVRPAN